MSPATTIYEAVDERVRRLSLNDPSTRNAYTLPMCHELLKALDTFAKDDTARVLILTGAGGTFCSGGNLRAEEELEIGRTRIMGHAAVMREGMHAVIKFLIGMDKPVIAQIDGAAVAGGLALASACDFRIASETARLGDTSGRAGLLPDEGGVWLWPRQIGLEPAMRMTMLGETYDARRALEIGLVGEVVPQAELARRTEELAGQLALKAPLVLRAVKRMMRKSLDQSLDGALSEIEFAVEVINHSADATEGIEAFRQKRAPSFKGN